MRVTFRKGAVAPSSRVVKDVLANIAIARDNHFGPTLVTAASAPVGWAFRPWSRRRSWARYPEASSQGKVEDLAFPFALVARLSECYRARWMTA
jgi:hypothetical protein